MSLWRNWIAHPSPKGKIAGSNPVRDVYTYVMTLWRNWIAHWTSNPEVAGSNPVKVAI